jgi:YD repeat-containing protein
MISTYAYDPLIGVTSITPPSGVREIYKYDSANRLQSVVDVNGKILKEYQYNYKQ